MHYNRNRGKEKKNKINEKKPSKQKPGKLN